MLHILLCSLLQAKISLKKKKKIFPFVSKM